MPGKTQPYFKSTQVEFKMFSTKESQKDALLSISSGVSAFINTEGGYIFFGVHDKTHQVTVLGSEERN